MLVVSLIFTAKFTSTPANDLIKSLASNAFRWWQLNDETLTL